MDNNNPDSPDSLSGDHQLTVDLLSPRTSSSVKRHRRMVINDLNDVDVVNRREQQNTPDINNKNGGGGSNNNNDVGFVLMEEDHQENGGNEEDDEVCILI